MKRALVHRSMSPDREWQLAKVALGLAGLLAFGCGITERHVEERTELGSGAGTDRGKSGAESGMGGAEPTVGGAAGHAAVGGKGGGGTAGHAAGGGKGGGGPVTGSGHELDPVEVGDLPPARCACGSGCVVESCDVVTVQQPSEFLMNVFVRSGQAYWMSQRNLGRVNIQTGSRVSMATELQIPSCVVVDAGFAYFSNYQGLWRVPRDTTAVILNGAGMGGVTLLSALSPWQRRLTEIAVDSQDVYWTAPPGLTPAQLKRTPVGGGDSVTLARLPNDDDWPLGLAVDDTDVYFTSNAALQRVPKAGGAVEALEPLGLHVGYDAIHPTLGIALDRAYVYFDAGSSLMRRSKRDADAVEIFAVPEGDELRGVVLDVDYAYFGTKSGNILRVPKLGGSPSVMVTGEQNPLVTAIDATSVYWVEQDLGRIRRAEK
ncbi:MAG: hypothetical protein ABUL60_16990 [Myxococcales bacterium]